MSEKKTETKKVEKTKFEIMKEFTIDVKKRYEATRSESWRVAFLCLSQGITKIEQAILEDEQRREKLKQMGLEINGQSR